MARDFHNSITSPIGSYITVPALRNAHGIISLSVRLNHQKQHDKHVWTAMLLFVIWSCRLSTRIHIPGKLSFHHTGCCFSRTHGLADVCCRWHHPCTGCKTALDPTLCILLLRHAGVILLHVGRVRIMARAVPNRHSYTDLPSC